MLFMPGKRISSYKIIFWSFSLLCGSLFFSCANEDCISIFNNHLLVEFVNADTLESGEIEFSPVDTMFYSITATGNDSILYNPDNIIRSTLTLPVDPASELTSFRLEMLDSIGYDTLSYDPVVIEAIYYVNPTPHIITVSYDRTGKIISVDCGVEITYTNLQIQEITFPTTHLVDNKLSRLNEVNIEVFF